ncbi:flagellar basal body P-ring protein FlgI [Escherichia coli]
MNQLNGGRITNGAVIEPVNCPASLASGIPLICNLTTKISASRSKIADTINRVRGYGSATALDARTIQVRVPSGNSSRSVSLQISRICRLMSPAGR